MKKIIALSLIGLFAGSLALFADDAKVLPAGVGRIYIANTYAFADGAYDVDGKFQKYDDGEGALKAYNLGLAIEYGITDWISAAVQWAPGVNLWSEVDANISRTMVAPGVWMDTGNTSKINVNDMSDIFLGSKIQVVGEKAPVQNELVRFAFALGMLIPTPGPNADDQLENLNADDPYTARVDRDAWAVGGRGYFDVVLSDAFFVNLYTQYKHFFETEQETAVYVAPALGDPNAIAKVKIAYGYELTLEAELHFGTMLGEGVQFSAGLPITYVISPDHKIDGTTVEDSGSQTLRVSPSVSFFLMNTPLPLEFELGYSLPVYGVNSRATNSLTLVTKVYFRF